MIFCPDKIIPDSGLTGPNNTYIYIFNTCDKCHLLVIIIMLHCSTDFPDSLSRHSSLSSNPSGQYFFTTSCVYTKLL